MTHNYLVCLYKQSKKDYSKEVRSKAKCKKVIYK